jgi:hypothetical protein
MGIFQQQPTTAYNFGAEAEDVNVTHVISKGLVSLLLISIATWWIAAPRSYAVCIRKVPLLWTSAYPMSTKAWFPQYLRAFGLVLLAFFLAGFFYWCRIR